MWAHIASISLGSSLGALLRWQLSLRLNALQPSLPIGTLAANLLGGYVVGLVVAWLNYDSQLSPQWRLFLVVGFCGGLTTFSTFSMEVVYLIQQGRFVGALSTIFLNLFGSLLMTVLGLWTWQLLRP